ncbi:MAG: type II secretion system F family protein [Actinomycetes bacterium]
MTALRASGAVAMALVGLWCIVASVPWFGRVRLAERLDPYVSGVPAPPSRWAWDGPRRFVAAHLVRHLRSEDLADRLATLGVRDVVAARTEQAVWVLIGAAIGLGVAGVAAGRGGASPALIGALVVCGACGGGMLWDRRITRSVATRRLAAASTFPTVADLLCLTVTAGESLRAALEHVADTATGPLAEEIAAALRDARAGRPLAECLVERADALGEPGFDRFVRAMVAASERGVAVGDALRAMAHDARDAQRVALLEAAGRKQVTMLIPVVTLILPVALVFAFFPGAIAIRNLT